jgi:hypothetical protein
MSIPIPDSTLFFFLPLHHNNQTGMASRLLVNSSWHPEYGRYMLEGTPGEPYMGLPRDLLEVERNMKLRYSSESTTILSFSGARYPINGTFWSSFVSLFWPLLLSGDGINVSSPWSC